MSYIYWINMEIIPNNINTNTSLSIEQISEQPEYISNLINNYNNTVNLILNFLNNKPEVNIEDLTEIHQIFTLPIFDSLPYYLRGESLDDDRYINVYENNYGQLLDLNEANIDSVLGYHRINDNIDSICSAILLRRNISITQNYDTNQPKSIGLIGDLTIDNLDQIFGNLFDNNPIKRELTISNSNLNIRLNINLSNNELITRSIIMSAIGIMELVELSKESNKIGTEPANFRLNIRSICNSLSYSLHNVIRSINESNNYMPPDAPHIH